MPRLTLDPLTNREPNAESARRHSRDASEPDAPHPDWDDSYARPRPPWDIGRPQPALVRLAEAGTLSGALCVGQPDFGGWQPSGSRIRDQRLTG